MNALSIAIVGAGPAGCFAAQILRKELSDAEITVLDRLPVPFGLLRYGVAADHQGTKAVQHQFDRLFQRSNVTFMGGIELGRDFDLALLTATFDVVVLATGVTHDRRVGVAGETLDGVIGAGRLTRAFNSHPEAVADLPYVCPRVAIVGSGNVAIDLLRLLSKRSDEWDGSDMDDAVLQRIIPRPVTEIHLISRSGAGEARWDPAMLRELGRLRRPSVRLLTGSVEAGQSSAADALYELLMAEQGPSDLNISLHMGCVVDEVLGRERVEGIRILSRAREPKTIGVDTVLTAIGFEHLPQGDLPPRVYQTGWLKTGPQGAIPVQRTLAKLLALEIVEALRSGSITPNRPGRGALPRRHTTDYAGWRQIDALERASAADRRVRRKITDIANMFAATGQNRQAAPPPREETP